MNKMLVVVMDVSGSMDGPKLEAAKKGAIKFIRKNMVVGDYLGLVKFSGNAGVVMPLREITNLADVEPYIQAINSLQIEGNTALWDALGMAVDLIVNSIRGISKKYDLLVLGVTDGEDNSSSRFTSGPSGADEVIRYGKSKGVDIKFLFIAIGSGVSVESLGRIGKVFPVEESPESIEGGFEKVGEVIDSTSSTLPPPSPLPKEVNECSRIGFEGEITRYQIAYMEQVAKHACRFINAYFPLYGGTTVVPVYLLTDNMFDKMFRSESCSFLCRYVFQRIRERLAEREYPTESHRDFNQNPDYRRLNGDRDRIYDVNPEMICCGKPVVVALLDDEYCKVKHSTKYAHAPSPGIYVRKSIRPILVKYALAYGAVESLIYYSTTRRIVNVDAEMLQFVSSAIALLSMPRRDLYELERDSDLFGAWALPLWIVKIFGIDGLCDILNSLNIDMIMDANMDIDTFKNLIVDAIDGLR